MNINTAMSLLKQAAEKCPELKPEIDELIQASGYDELAKAYIANDGMVCPSCNNRNIRLVGRESHIGNSVYADNVCNACGAAWVERFDLAGFEELETQDMSENKRGKT